MRFAIAVLIAIGLFAPRAALIQNEWSHFHGSPVSLPQILSGEDPRSCNWDCNLYVGMAARKDLETDRNLTAFFPAWSSLIRAGIKTFPKASPRAIALWLSNGLLILSVAAALIVASDLSLKTGVLSVLFLPLSILIFPYSVPSSFGYGESIFLFLYILTFIALYRKRVLAASFLIGLLGVTRPQGVWIAVVFSGTLFFEKLFNKRSRKFSTVITLCFISFAPFFLYMLWQWRYYGDPLLFLHSQVAWKRGFTLVRGILDQLPRIKPFQILIWTALIGSYYAIKKREFHWVFIGITTLLLTELPLFSGGLMSYSRYLSVNFGMFLGAAVFFTAVKKAKGRKFALVAEILVLVWCFSGFFWEMKEYLYNPGYCP